MLLPAGELCANGAREDPWRPHRRDGGRQPEGSRVDRDGAGAAELGSPCRSVQLPGVCGRQSVSLIRDP
jgi:hypothetical protein